MASKNDKKNEPDLFDRLADMNGDGKTDLFEEMMAYQRIRDTFEKTGKDSQDADFKNLKDSFKHYPATDQHDWRETYYFGDAFDVDPEDYETEDEYLEALEEAIDAKRTYDSIPYGNTHSKYNTNSNTTSMKSGTQKTTTMNHSSSVRQPAQAKSSGNQKVQPQETKHENVLVLLGKSFWMAVREMFLPMLIGGIIFTLGFWLLCWLD